MASEAVQTFVEAVEAVASFEVAVARLSSAIYLVDLL